MMTVTLQPTRAARAAHCVAFTIAALTLGLPGCAHHVTPDRVADQAPAGAEQLFGPAPGGWSGGGARFDGQTYPLGVGDRWDYTIRHTQTIVRSGRPAPSEPLVEPWRVEIVGTRVLAGRGYFAQLEWNPEIASLVPPDPFLLRADRTGLYQADALVLPDATGSADRGTDAPSDRGAGRLADQVAAEVPAADRAAFLRAAAELASKLATMRRIARGAGLAPSTVDEITLLRYPLFRGSRWVVRDAPRFGRRVVGLDHVRVPAGSYFAWRIAGDSEFFGPEDQVTLWYAREGLIRTLFHAEAVATDDTGTPLGRLVVVVDQALTSVSLVEPRQPRALADTPRAE